MKIAIMAGGTGGHIFPGLAVAKYLIQYNVEVIWFGAIGGMEEALVKKNNIAINLLAIKGLRGKGIKGLFTMPIKLFKATKSAMSILKKEKVDVVVSMGGYVAAPGGIAAKFCGIPLLVHEQNGKFGMTNKYLAKIAKKVLTGFDMDEQYNSQWIGNPVREDIENCKPIKRTEKKIRILIIGGSLGARSLNTIIPKLLKPYINKNYVTITHQCGKNNKSKTEQKYKSNEDQLSQSVRVSEFIEDMASAYANTDFIIARAGALTIAEINAVGLPAILIPYPHAVDDHQTLNASKMANGNAGYIWQEKDDIKELKSLIYDFMSSPVLRKEMAKNSKKLHKNKAAQRVAEICMDIAQ